MIRTCGTSTNIDTEQTAGLTSLSIMTVERTLEITLSQEDMRANEGLD